MFLAGAATLGSAHMAGHVAGCEGNLRFFGCEVSATQECAPPPPSERTPHARACAVRVQSIAHGALRESVRKAHAKIVTIIYILTIKDNGAEI